MTPPNPPRPSTELFDDALKLSPKQRLVLDTLQDFPAGARAVELAETLNMHVNTVRGHLDELVEQRAVQVLRSPAQGRGRPSLIFQVRVPNTTAVANEYISLVEVLAAALEEKGGDVAGDIGRAWAEKMSADTRPTPETIDAAVGRLYVLLRDIGFDPELPTPTERRDSPDEAVLPLHSCPFIGADGAAPSKFICEVHAGFLRANVSENLHLTLTPLSAERQCRVHLSNG